MEHHTGTAFFAVVYVRHRDHPAGVDLRQRTDFVLHLHGADFLAAPVDEFLDSAPENNVSVLIQLSEVTRMQPPIRIDRFRGLLRLVIVSLHHEIALDADFSHLSGRQCLPGFQIRDLAFHVVHKLAHCGAALFHAVVQCAHCQARGGLGLSQARRQRHPEALFDSDKVVGRIARPADDSDPQGADVVFSEVLPRHNGPVHGRYRVQNRAAVPLDRPED